MDVDMQDKPKADGAAREATPAEQSAAAAAPPGPPNPDLDTYRQHWRTVQDDPTDFNTWTALLTVSEKLDDMEKLRAAYDAFLAEYPLCYGYWKKYADAEARHQLTDHALHVYERGVAATPYSADLWAHYAAFKKSLPGTSPDDVRGVYERGLAYLSTDYNVHTLWDKYFAFEQEQGSTLHIATLYVRALTCPIKELDRYYTSFKNYVHPLAAPQVALPDVYDAIRVKLEADKKERAEQAARDAAALAEAAKAASAAAADGAAAEAEKPVKVEEEEAAPGTEPAAAAAEGGAGSMEGVEAAAAKPEANGDAAGGVKAEPGDADKAAAAGDAKAEPAAVIVTEDEIKAVWLRQQDEVYERAKAELLRRKPFEDAVRRPYYHVKPLDGVQLWNWIRYLDWVEAHGDQTAAITLYERCLVACANYPEFWQRYVRFLDRTDPASARPTLDRAVLGFCKRRAEMHLFAAQYDEHHGDVDGARTRYKHILNSVAPRLLEAVTASANFERRQGNPDAACAQLQELLGEEKAREGSRIYPFLSIHYAHFLRRHKGDVEEARKVLDEALKQCPHVRSLWEGAIHFEEHVGGPAAVQRALQLYEQCTAENPPGADAAAAAAAGGAGSAASAGSGSGAPKWLAERDREELSARAVDFADMYGTREQLQEAAARHAQRFMLPTSVTAEARTAAAAANKRGPDGQPVGHTAKAARPEHHTAHQHHAAAAVAAPMAAAAAGYGYPAAPAAAAAAYGQYYGYGQYPAQQYPGYGAYPGYGY